MRWPSLPQALSVPGIALPPRGDRLWTDAQVTGRERDQRSRSPCRISDSVRGRGGPVTNMSNDAPFHPCEKVVPQTCAPNHLECHGESVALIFVGPCPNLGKPRRLADEIQKGQHRGTAVACVGVVKITGWQLRAPIRQNLDQRARCEGVARIFFQNMRDTLTCNRGLQFLLRRS
jgi:hypothetical protein